MIVVDAYSKWIEAEWLYQRLFKGDNLKTEENVFEVGSPRHDCDR